MLVLLVFVAIALAILGIVVGFFRHHKQKKSGHRRHPHHRLHDDDEELVVVIHNTPFSAELLRYRHNHTHKHTHPSHILWFIPGNPGVVDFYRPFLKHLHQLLHDKHHGGEAAWEVVGVAHAGHGRRISKLHGKKRFNLDEQIAHHAGALQQRLRDLPAHTRVVIAGHSVGAYIGLRVLEKLGNDVTPRLDHAIMLFPTLMEIAKTPNGLKLSPKFPNPAFRFGFSALVWLLNVLPASVSRKILQRHIEKDFDKQSPNWKEEMDLILHIATALVDPDTVSGCLHMAHTEMQEIGPLQEVAHILHQHQHQITLYFGDTDEWAPLDYLTEIRGTFSRCRVLVDNTSHAFVMGSSQHVAAKVVGFVGEN